MEEEQNRILKYKFKISIGEDATNVWLHLWDPDSETFNISKKWIYYNFQGHTYNDREKACIKKFDYLQNYIQTPSTYNSPRCYIKCYDKDGFLCECHYKESSTVYWEDPEFWRCD